MRYYASSCRGKKSKAKRLQLMLSLLVQHHGQRRVQTLHCFSTTDSAEQKPCTAPAPRTELNEISPLLQHRWQRSVSTQHWLSTTDSSGWISHISQPLLMRTRVVLMSAIHATSGDSLQTCRVQLLLARSLCGCQLHENLFHYPAGCWRNTRLRNFNHGRCHHRTLMNNRPTFDLNAEHWDTTFIGVPSHLLHWGWGSGGSCWGCGRCLQLGCWCRSWLIAGEGWPGCPSLGSGCPALEENTAGRVLNVASQGELEVWHTVIQQACCGDSSKSEVDYLQCWLVTGPYSSSLPR